MANRLTTTFTPPPSCTTDVYYLTKSTSSFFYQLGDPSNPSQCFPPGWQANTYFYYSPGVCPQGYTTGGCSQVINSGVTTATCCPVGYQCATVSPYWFTGELCSRSLGSSGVTTVTNVISGVTGLATNTYGYYDGINAYGVRIRYASSDFGGAIATATSLSSSSTTSSSRRQSSSTSSSSRRQLFDPSSSSSTNTATTNTLSPATPTPTPNPGVAVAYSDDGGLSTGAKVGIGVGVGVGALAILAALLFFFLRRRRSSAAATAAAAAAAPGSTTSGPNGPVTGAAVSQSAPAQAGAYQSQNMKQVPIEHYSQGFWQPYQPPTQQAAHELPAQAHS